MVRFITRCAPTSLAVSSARARAATSWWRRQASAPTSTNAWTTMLAATQRVITLMVRTSATGSIAVRYRVSFAERLTSSSVRRCMRIHVFAASWASGAFGTSGTCGASGASGASSASGASAASGVTGVSVASAAYFSHLNERDLCGVWLSGSFQCRCNDGFELQGQFACVNVDECALGLAPCDRECEDTQTALVQMGKIRRG